ncbi:hypothetical protein L1987_74473 [Smallanthus sonchifolius]|uniref:Uncharacterized protein n=1 Tax=Smallanthus sonchifolius TaxID=185202 RepID=A0ACB9A222_9ASTR|nr:hypothetical protein L1987_74473 [Smallanthus sonchifolius]
MAESNNAPTISVLSEGCVSDILSNTSPRDACRAASISKEFNLAADSDAVWDRFLPPDHREVIARAVSPVVFDSKKQLYHRLSESYILLGRGYLVGILRNVWWLDIHGQIASVMLSRKTTYVAYLVYRITRDSWGLSEPGKTIVSFGGVRNETSNVYFQDASFFLSGFR